MPESSSAGQGNTGAIRAQAMGSGRDQEDSKGRCSDSFGNQGQAGPEAESDIPGRVRANEQGACGSQRCSGSCRASALLVKKKSELGLEGPLTGHYPLETRNSVVEAINAAVDDELTQRSACAIMGLSVRKFRRWKNPKPKKKRIPWNKILPEEVEAITNAVYSPELLGKPLSHIYVHGQDTGKYFASISTLFRVLKEKNLVREKIVRYKRPMNYVDIREILGLGLNVLCYDGTAIKTLSGTWVWAIPVLLLPHRYLLYIGRAVGSFNSKDLQKSIDTALIGLPDRIRDFLVSHCDRGSQMKSKLTRDHLAALNIPVHFGRPHNPDDEPWIEALNNSVKHHRDAPSEYKTVLDVFNWLDRMPDIHNNEPHWGLNLVTPQQSLDGLKEVILALRQFNLKTAREKRLLAYRSLKSGIQTGELLLKK